MNIGFASYSVRAPEDGTDGCGDLLSVGAVLKAGKCSTVDAELLECGGLRIRCSFGGSLVRVNEMAFSTLSSVGKFFSSLPSLWHFRRQGSCLTGYGDSL